MRNGMKVVDADAHHNEPADLWEKYIDRRFKDAAPRVARLNEAGKPAWVIEGESILKEKGRYRGYSVEMQKKNGEIVEQGLKRLVENKFSNKARLMDMDDFGVDVQILFPSRGGQLLGRDFKDLDLLDAVCRAYNDWAAEYSQADPKRLRWAAMIPVQDLGRAIKEIERTAKNGAVSAYFRPNPAGGRNLFDPENDPMWEVIQKLDLPVSIHDSGSPYQPSYGSRMSTHTEGHILAHPFEAMGNMAGFIYGGVVERFPKLTIVHVEADAGWAPYWVQRMEQHWEYSGNAETEMTMSPTKYFKRNFFVACRADEPTLPAAVQLLGDQNFLWNTDYPHPDGTWLTGLPDMDKQPISQQNKANILGENAFRAFRLN